MAQTSAAAKIQTVRLAIRPTFSGMVYDFYYDQVWPAVYPGLRIAVLRFRCLSHLSH